MLLKANWKEYIHTIRRREIERAFAFFGPKQFESGIEFGAGDGYQTTLLAPHCSAFVSSDLNFSRFKEKLKLPGVEYVQCDADRLEGVFEGGRFDLVVSSSMVEHLSNPAGFLKSTHHILKDSGYAIHIVPSRFLKVAYLVLFYPNLCLLVLDRFVGLFKRKEVFRGKGIQLENNINAAPQTAARFKKLLVPQIHGNYSSHMQEFIKWGKRHWEELFSTGGFEIVACVRGPVFSGYGFGFNTLRRVAEYFGAGSEYIFILKKK